MGVRAGSRWPFTSGPNKNGSVDYTPFPFFLAYATSLLKKEQKEARLLDAIAEGVTEEEVMEKIRSYNPGLIVAETSTPSFKNDTRILCDIRLNFPHSCIAICGPHASIFPGEILKNYDFIDYILIGEYEYTLLDLVKSLDAGSCLGSVPRLAYRQKDSVEINGARPTIDNLDSLPWPERETCLYIDIMTVLQTCLSQMFRCYLEGGVRFSACTVSGRRLFTGSADTGKGIP